MKKIITLLLALTLMFCFVACGNEGVSNNGNENNDESSNSGNQNNDESLNENNDKLSQIKIGVMNGPTGMGIAKLINDYGMESDKYVFKTYSDPTDATATLTNGENDMLCVPTNLAANLFSKKSDFITVAAINCLGSLYVVAKDGIEINSISDLSGKTIYYGVKTSTTEPILSYILEQNGIEANVIAEQDHDVVTTKMVKGEIDIAVIPEPKATASVNGAKAKGQNYSIKLSLSEEWDAVSDTGLAMGCIIVKNDFLKNNKSSVDAFLKEYKSSIEFIGNEENKSEAAQMIVDAGILPKLPIATAALGNLYGAIVYIDGEDMKNTLVDFYKNIGMALPGEDFYY